MEEPSPSLERSGTSGPHGAEGLADLSASQREVWLDQQSWPSSHHLHIGGAVYLVGPLDMGLFTKSLALLVAECEALRLIPTADGRQQLSVGLTPNLELIDFGGGQGLRERMAAAWAEDIKRPFAPGRPPWRFVLYRTDGPLHGLSLHYHHLIMDGWGTSLVLQRWTEIYNLLSVGTDPAPTGGGYLDFMLESNAYLASDTFQKDLGYWMAQIPELPPPLIEPRAVKARDGSLPPTHLVAKRIPRSTYNRIAAFAVERQFTTFTVFLAAMAIYFGKVHRRNELIIGIPSLNRSGRRFKEVPGMFVGVMAVPIRWAAGATVTDLLSSVAATIRGGLRHSRFPLSELGRRLGAVRSGRDSAFDLLLSFERQDYKLAFGAAKLEESRQNFAGVSRYPCSITVCEFNADEDVEVILEASSACFEPSEAGLLWDRLVDLVGRLTDAPAMRIEDLTVLPASEFALLTQTLQPPPCASEDLCPFPESFERWAAATPQALAVRWDQGQMHYASLQQAARQLALRLHADGVGRNDVVALAIERSPHLIVAMLGISMAGAAFLPLDPDAPPARLADILTESRSKAFIIHSSTWPRMGSLHVHVLQIDLLKEEAPEAELPRPRLEDLAYVLFTSGSTGKPKGVAVEHGALAARLNWLSGAFGVSSSDCGGQGTLATFDPSLVEWCLPLAMGASVALPPPGRLLPETLAEFASRHGVTFMAFVPSTLSRFVDAAKQLQGLRLRVACCGGEVLPPELVQQYLRVTGARLYNVYGPTEATIFATAWPAVDAAGGNTGALPIGKAIAGARIYVLDSERKVLPVGVAGEIYIGGQGVARGYLHRPELTEQAFFPDPFQADGRMYKTGDRGWLSADAMLHFSGRLDRQVKLRGYRIELGEIEAVLASLPGVSAAAAKLVERAGKPEICAWASGNILLEPSDLLKALRQRMPAYMVPSTVSVLQKMPESGTGKIDYASLPLPDAPQAKGSGRSPENELERELLNLWQKALKAPTLTVEDNVFDAGGDSLAAISVLTGIEKLVGRRVPMYLLSERPTVEALAASLGEDSAPSRLLIHLDGGSPDQEKPSGQAPLFLAASGHGDLMRFQTLARALSGAVEVRMLQPPVARTIARTADLATLYAEAIHDQGVSGCYLGGFSVGGLAALETAIRLRHDGVDVRGLFLIDTIYPSRLWGGTFLWRLMGWLVRRLHIQDLSMNGRRLGAMLGDTGLVGQVMAVSGYRASKFQGTTHLVKSVALAARLDRILFLGWRLLLGRRMLEYTVRGLHGSMFEPANIEDLAKVIRVVTSKEAVPLGHSSDFPVRHG